MAYSLLNKLNFNTAVNKPIVTGSRDPLPSSSHFLLYVFREYFSQGCQAAVIERTTSYFRPKREIHRGFLTKIILQHLFPCTLYSCVVFITSIKSTSSNFENNFSTISKRGLIFYSMHAKLLSIGTPELLVKN